MSFVLHPLSPLKPSLKRKKKRRRRRYKKIENVFFLSNGLPYYLYTREIYHRLQLIFLINFYFMFY